MQRAKLLYERALLSLDSNLAFWLQYVDFIQRSLKDIASVRAKFEARKASGSAYSQGDIVELMLENALFEEEQNQVQKSRKIYETLVVDVVPGHIKSIIAYVAFERRMNNTEKAKDLLFKAFESSLAKGEP